MRLLKKGSFSSDNKAKSMAVSETPADGAKKKENKTGLDIVLGFVFVAAIIRLFGVIVVSGQSMEPTFHDGDIVLMQTIGNHFEKGQCIVFRNKHEERMGKHLIKRIVATAGDRVSSNPQTGELFINGESVLVPELPIDPEDATEMPLTVPEGYLFVVGDNYNHSTDSRYSVIGLVSEKEVAGKVVVQISKKEGIVIVDQTPRDYGT